MIQRKFGNILGASENIIVQSVNHRGKMASGLAKQIVSKYPIINDRESMYQAMCKEMRFVDIKSNGLIAWCAVETHKYIASIFGQEYYGRDKRYTDYVALGNGLDSVRLLAIDMNLSVAIPFMLGSGLGGGKWEIVLDIINDCFKYSPEVDVSIYELQ